MFITNSIKIMLELPIQEKKTKVYYYFFIEQRRKFFPFTYVFKDNANIRSILNQQLTFCYVYSHLNI